jgi:hypothetical protein
MFGFPALIREIGSPAAYIVMKATIEIPRTTGIMYKSRLTMYLNIALPASPFSLLDKRSASPLLAQSLSMPTILKVY